LAAALCATLAAAQTSAQAPVGAPAPAPIDTTHAPFRDTHLAPEARIANILFLMTADEKIAALSTDSGVPRLSIPSFGSTEGIHGVVRRGDQSHQKEPITTTQFPQPPGMGASWDPAVVKQAGAVQSTEDRHITQSARY